MSVDTERLSIVLNVSSESAKVPASIELFKYMSTEKTIDTNAPLIKSFQPSLNKPVFIKLNLCCDCSADVSKQSFNKID